MAKLASITWRGILLRETASGNLEGDNPAAQVRLTRELNESWTGLVNYRSTQWTGNGDSPLAVLEQLNTKIVASRDFLLSDGEAVEQKQE